jgi:hypothetical protein
MQLYEPERHEPLTATEWDERRARAAIDEILGECLEVDHRFPTVDTW